MEPWFASPEGPILRLYELISGPPELERPWSDVRALFWPDARLRIAQPQPDGSEWVGEFSVQEFAAQAAIHYREAGFWEREMARRVQRFGNIAHVWSTYESRTGTPESEPIARGINSVQLWRRDGRWRIVSVLWHNERVAEPIPPEYLSGRETGGSSGGAA
jgi:hypothetical protein